MPVDDEWAGAPDSAPPAGGGGSKFDAALRTSIDQALVDSADGLTAALSPAELELKREQMAAAEEAAALESGTSVLQAAVRSRNTSKARGPKTAEEMRTWRFRKTHERAFDTAGAKTLFEDKAREEDTEYVPEEPAEPEPEEEFNEGNVVDDERPPCAAPASQDRIFAPPNCAPPRRLSC